MIKVIASFEQEVEGKIGRFYVDYDTPISSAKEMAFAFLKHLGNIEDQAKAKMAQDEAIKNQCELKDQEMPIEESAKSE